MKNGGLIKSDIGSYPITGTFFEENLSLKHPVVLLTRKDVMTGQEMALSLLFHVDLRGVPFLCRKFKRFEKYFKESKIPSVVDSFKRG